MNLYEFEGKNIFAKYGIRIPRSVLIRRGDDVTRAYTALGIWKVVLKAQILSGKRGKNQGILFCSSPEETEKACKDIYKVQNKALKEKYNVPVMPGRTTYLSWEFAMDSRWQLLNLRGMYAE